MPRFFPSRIFTSEENEENCVCFSMRSTTSQWRVKVGSSREFFGRYRKNSIGVRPLTYPFAHLTAVATTSFSLWPPSPACPPPLALCQREQKISNENRAFHQNIFSRDLFLNEKRIFFQKNSRKERKSIDFKNKTSTHLITVRRSHRLSQTFPMSNKFFFHKYSLWL